MPTTLSIVPPQTPGPPRRRPRSLEEAKDDLERQMDDVARTHAGRPQPEVLDALERLVSAAGITPRRADLSSFARTISDAGSDADRS